MLGYKVSNFLLFSISVLKNVFLSLNSFHFTHLSCCCFFMINQCCNFFVIKLNNINQKNIFDLFTIVLPIYFILRKISLLIFTFFYSIYLAYRFGCQIVLKNNAIQIFVYLFRMAFIFLIRLFSVHLVFGTYFLWNFGSYELVFSFFFKIV